MLLQDLKILLKQKLKTHFEAVELSSIIGILIEEVSGWNRTQQILHQNTAFNQAQVDQPHRDDLSSCSYPSGQQQDHGK